MNITAILPFKCGEMTGTFVLFTGSCCCNGEERGEVWEGCFSRTNRGKEAKAG
jgi:hypothetical protein